MAARIIKKVDCRATLLSFNVGDEMVFPHEVLPYTAIYPMTKDINSKTGYLYEVSVKNCANGTRVRRIH